MESFYRLCFHRSPVRDVLDIESEKEQSRERVHARDTEKYGEREHASKPASDRKTRLRSFALEYHPEKHSMVTDAPPLPGEEFFTANFFYYFYILRCHCLA